MCAILCLCKFFGLCSEQIASMHHATCERKRVLWLSCCKWCTDMKKVQHLRLEKGSVNGNWWCYCCNAFAKLFNFFFDIEFFFLLSLFIFISLEIFFGDLAFLECVVVICLEYSRMNCNFEFLDIEDATKMRKKNPICFRFSVFSHLNCKNQFGIFVLHVLRN